MIGEQRTLSDVFRSKRNSKETVTFIKSSDQELSLSYQHLFTKAANKLYALQQKGIKAGDKVILQLADPEAFVISFWACILGGMVPVPLKAANSDEELLKVVKVCECLEYPYMIAHAAHVHKLHQFISLHHARLLPLLTHKCMPEDEIGPGNQEGRFHVAQENDIAYIQFSSGSTNLPKGIQLTHRNLLTNIRAILDGISAPATGDVFFSWMPLTHDMGLIGYHLTPLYAGWRHYIMPTELFIRRPVLWLEKMSRHKATFTASPNFGYKYVLNYLSRADIPGMDLSHLRIITNGAEPISAAVCREFETALAKHGLKQHVIFPVYGLAEASLAVTFSQPGMPLQTITVSRHALQIGEKVKLADSEDEGIVLVNVGKPLNANCQVRVLLENGREAAAGVVGHIYIKGDNVTAGYYNNEPANADLFTAGGWLRTGDLGFFMNGALYITGRYKDIIFLNGLNLYPHDIEHTVEQAGLVEPGKLAVAGCFNHAAGQEEVIAFVVHKGKEAAFAAQAAAIRKCINSTHGLNIHKILPVVRIPKTTSGKFQRYKLIRQYQEGLFREEESRCQALLEQEEGPEAAVPPANETEIQLLEIWKDVLQAPAIGVQHSFFENGGNSLKAGQLLAKVQETFQVELDFRQLYLYPSVRKLADVIKTLPVTACRDLPLADGQQGYYPLSAAQQGVYYFWELNREAIAYNIPVAFSLEGQPDIPLLEEAIRKVIARHEILRTAFSYVDETPRQFVLPAIDFELVITGISPGNIQEELRNRVRPFDLHTAPLFRIELLQLPDSWILFMDFHHIIFDGSSYAIFLEELAALYGRQAGLAAPVPYRRFVAWEMEQQAAPPFRETEAYWLNAFRNGIPRLDLPADHSRPALIDYKGEKLEFLLDRELSHSLRKLAAAKGVTPHVLFLATFNVLLSRYAGQEEVVVGVPASVRNHPGLFSQPGMFVNNLVVRSQVQGDSAFTDLLAAVQDHFQEVLKHSSYPFENIIQKVPFARANGYHPAFGVELVFQDFGPAPFQTRDFKAERYFFDPGISKYDLTLELFNEEEGFRCYIEYATRLFNKVSIQHFYSSYVLLLKQIVADPGCRISAIPLLSANQLDAYVHGFNDTAAVYPALTLHALIEQQVRQTPERTAVAEEERSLSYQELGNFSDRLAAWLHSQGVSGNRPVAVILDRSIELVIALTGVLKAGACYVPIDTSLPAGRIAYLLANSGAVAIITSSGWLEAGHQQMPALQNLPLLLLDTPETLPAAATEWSPAGNAGDLAYIIYTSGSTGQPKGVMIAHHAVVNYLQWARKAYLEDEPACFAFYTAISFDLTVTAVFLPLISGGTVVVFREDDPSALISKVVMDKRVNMVKATPSHLKILKEDPALKQQDAASNVSTLIVGGEALHCDLARQVTALFREKIRIYNEYGPTEATVGCMIHLYNPAEDTAGTVPIGRPVDNAQVYLLDSNRQPVPPNVKGEIYVSGEGLARGYWHNGDLTARKFLPHAFIAGKRMYRTGDTGVRDSSGRMRFTGRADDQLKINGYRIEPGEIEAALLRHEKVNGAAIIKAGEENGSAYLCAYFSTSNGQPLQSEILKGFLALTLPAYMLPARYVQLDRIPLTVNGKINVQELPPPPKSVWQHTDMGAHTGMAQVMAEVWADVLNTGPVNVDDNFIELGGDSIKAVQVAARLLEQELSLNARDILLHQTIRQIIAAGKARHQANPYEQTLLSGHKDLTPIEHWFFEQQLRAPGYYTQSVLLEWNGRIDRGLLEPCLHEIMTHHDGLRLNYDRQEARLFFNNDPQCRQCALPVFDIARLSPGKRQESIKEICISQRSSLHILSGSLLRAAIIQTAEKDYLFLTVHHLGIDGYSWRILLEDLRTAYHLSLRGKKLRLPAKTASLRDWYDYLQSCAVQQEGSGLPAYWMNSAPPLQVTLKGPVEKIKWSLGREQTAFLTQEAHKLCHANTQAILLTALAGAMADLAGTAATMVELEHHGRSVNGIDVSRTVGWLTTLYPVKLHYPDHTDPLAAIAAVKAQLDSVPDNGMAYGILKYLKKAIPAAAGPCAVRFNYLGSFDREISNELFVLSSMDTGPDVSPLNAPTAGIEMNLLVVNGALTLELSYDTSVHDSKDIRAFKENYTGRLLGILEYLNKGRMQQHFVPADFDTVQLSQDDLDMLFME